MNKFSLKMMACMAAMMMSQTAQSKTQDVGGRVIDQDAEDETYGQLDDNHHHTGADGL